MVERNARTRFGEIDLICCGEGALVFVEVKALRGPGEEAASRALGAIGPRKRARIRRLARAWLAEHRPPAEAAEIRFDAIGVSIGPGERANGLVHIRAAF